MSATPSLTAHNGHLEPNNDLHRDFGLSEGATLYLVSATDREIILRREQQEIPVTARMSTEEYMSGWVGMLGILKDGVDTAEERRQETAWELAHDRRKFGDE